MSDSGAEEALSAYVQGMLDNHTRLVEAVLHSHENEWEATKHAYPPDAFQKLLAARASAGCASSTCNPSVLPQPLIDDIGSFSAESSCCSVCLEPLLSRPSVQGPFTVGFSLQVMFCKRAACYRDQSSSSLSQQYFVSHRPFHQDEGQNIIESSTVILHGPGMPVPICDATSRVLLRQLLCLTEDGNPMPWRGGAHHFPHVVHDACARAFFKFGHVSNCPVAKCNLGSSLRRPFDFAGADAFDGVWSEYGDADAPNDYYRLSSFFPRFYYDPPPPFRSLVSRFAESLAGLHSPRSFNDDPRYAEIRLLSAEWPMSDPDYYFNRYRGLLRLEPYIDTWKFEKFSHRRQSLAQLDHSMPDPPSARFRPSGINGRGVPGAAARGGQAAARSHAHLVVRSKRGARERRGAQK
jgi:hypothetical protein